MVTPKTVIHIIDKYFENAKSITADMSFDIQVSSYHAVLSFIYDLLENIPEELLPHDEADKINFYLSKFSINSCLARWKNGDNIVMLSKVPQGGYVIPLLRSILERCPEEILSPETIELNFVEDKLLRDSIRDDLKNVESAFKMKGWKTVIVFAGSAMESILYYIIGRNNINTIASLKISQQNLENSSLGQLIDWACQANILEKNNDKDDKSLAKVCKNFRNLIHKAREIRIQEEPSEYMAYTSIGAIKMIINRVEKFLK